MSFTHGCYSYDFRKNLISYSHIVNKKNLPTFPHIVKPRVPLPYAAARLGNHVSAA